MDDREIVDLYWQRSESAIAETERKYGRYCRAIAARILYNEADAEECVSDTWLHAWNAMPADRPSLLSVYLGKLTRWLSLSRLRDQKRLKRGSGEASVALEELNETLAAKETAESRAEYDELTRILDAFVAQLREPERSVFLCRYWYLADVAEIAERFSFSQSKVKSMLGRTRKKLKAKLLEEGYTV